MVIHADSGGRLLAVIKGCALVLSASDTVKRVYMKCILADCCGDIT